MPYANKIIKNKNELMRDIELKKFIYLISIYS